MGKRKSKLNKSHQKARQRANRQSKVVAAAVNQHLRPSQPARAASPISLTPQDFINHLMGQNTGTRGMLRPIKLGQPVLIGADNARSVLSSLNVSGEALESTINAVTSVSNMPGMRVEAVDGKIRATTADAKVSFELPVFQGDNILTKGGNRWSSIGGVNEFNAAGEGNFKSFHEWFNQTITNMASDEGLDASERGKNLRSQISKVFSQSTRDGDAGRAMVEPVVSGGKWKDAGAVTKSRTHSLVFAPGSDVDRAYRNLQTKTKERLGAASRNQGLSAAIKGEAEAREEFAKSVYKSAGNVPGKNQIYSDTIFSATKRGLFEPLVDDSGRLHVQLSSMQPAELIAHSDTSEVAKGLSQLRHAKFMTEQELKDRAARGHGGGNRPSRMGPAIQTRERFGWQAQASRVRGSGGTFSPMAKVGMFADPDIAATLIKDSGGFRGRGSHISDPAFSTMGEVYTKRVVIDGGGAGGIPSGMFDPEVEKEIARQIELQARRKGKQTLEFGSYSGGRGLGLNLSDYDKGNNILGLNYSTASKEGMTKSESAARAVRLDSKYDTIEGFKIKDGEIEFTVRRSGHGGSLAGSLLVGEEGKRITGPRVLDLSLSEGGYVDVIADLDMTEVDSTGKIVAKTGDDFANKGGAFARRQLQTVAMRVEKRFGEEGLKAFGRAFGLEFSETSVKGAPTLLLDPGNNVSFEDGMEKFRQELKKKSSPGNPGGPASFHTEYSKTIPGSAADKGFAKKVRAGLDDFSKKVVGELSEIEYKTLNDKTITRLLKESNVIFQKSGQKPLIWDAENGKARYLASPRGQELFAAYKERMGIFVFDDIVVERVDRVTSSGIKSDGRSSGRIGVSRLGYIQEAINTRAISIGDPTSRKALQDFQKHVIREALPKANRFVFDELSRLSEPWRGAGNRPGATIYGLKDWQKEFGTKLGRDIEARRPGTGAVPLHELGGTPFHGFGDVEGFTIVDGKRQRIIEKATTGGLRTEGAYLDLGHDVDLSAGRGTGKPGDLQPMSAKANRIYIPSPADVLHTDQTKSVFMPSGGESSQSAYIKLMDHISKLRQEGPLTQSQAQGVADLYNEFTVRFAREAMGKGGKLASTALNPTFARYGALASLDILKGDTVAVTESGFEEMLRKSDYGDRVKDEIRKRVHDKDFRVGFLADPMSTREHYRGAILEVLPDNFIDDGRFQGVTSKGAKASAKDVIYASEAIMHLLNRDQDADHAVIQLLSSVSEHNMDDSAHSVERFVMEQEGLRAIGEDSAHGIKGVQDVIDARRERPFVAAATQGTTVDIHMPKGSIAGRLLDINEAAKLAADAATPGALTPVTETWWSKVSAVTNVAYDQRARAAAGASEAEVLESIVKDIMSKTGKAETDVMRREVEVLAKSLLQSSGEASQFHVAYKYTMLQKVANQTDGKQASTFQFIDELEKAIARFSQQSEYGNLATAELDELTNSILNVMTGSEYDPASTNLSDVKHPVGVAGEGDYVAKHFARTAARELVASEVILSRTGHLNPLDLASKGSEHLDHKVHAHGGEVRAAGAVVDEIAGQPSTGPSPGRVWQDAGTWEAQEAANNANRNIPPTNGPPNPNASNTPGAGAAGETGAEWLARIEERPEPIEQLNSSFGRMRDAAKAQYETLKRVWNGPASKGKYAMIGAASVIGFEMVRSAVSGMSDALGGTDLATPTAPMPPSPLLSQPMGSTFDSRMLPQQNRTRIQRTPGMRTHTSVSAQSDSPIDFSGMPSASVGNYSTNTVRGGGVTDRRRSHGQLEEEARRRLYAAY